MANGVYEPEWCKERHNRLDSEIKELWKEHRILEAKMTQELKKVEDKVNDKFNLILFGLITNLLTLVFLLAKVIYGG